MVGKSKIAIWQQIKLHEKVRALRRGKELPQVEKMITLRVKIPSDSACKLCGGKIGFTSFLLIAGEPLIQKRKIGNGTEANQLK